MWIDDGSEWKIVTFLISSQVISRAKRKSCSGLLTKRVSFHDQKKGKGKLFCWLMIIDAIKKTKKPQKLITTLQPQSKERFELFYLSYFILQPEKLNFLMELFIRPKHFSPETSMSRCFCVDLSWKQNLWKRPHELCLNFFVYRWSLLTQCFLYSLRKLSFSLSRRPLLWLELTHCPQSTDSYHFSIHNTCYTTRFSLACFTSWAYEGTIRKFIFFQLFDFE